jgi:phosphoglycerate dehydrogenase-like enzyme
MIEDTSLEILVTIPSGIREQVLPEDARDRLERVGDVTWNSTDEQFAPDELGERLGGTDVLVTGWGCPTLTADVLGEADRLELVAHVGGSVAFFATDALYDRGVTVCSTNRVLARFVAEGILASALAALRNLPAIDAEMAAGKWPNGDDRYDTLFETTVGFVGLGAVGEELLDLLEPFDVDVSVYDPHLSKDDLADREFAESVDLRTALAESDVVSVHAAKTAETVDLLNAERLEQLRDGALLLNAARGAIVDEAALTDELRSGRIAAALDVFEAEPLPADSELRSLDAVLLTPHVAGSPAKPRLGRAAVEQVERFASGKRVQNTVSRDRFEGMTDDRL